jgi:hypothetical protein
MYIWLFVCAPINYRISRYSGQLQNHSYAHLFNIIMCFSLWPANWMWKKVRLIWWVQCTSLVSQVWALTWFTKGSAQVSHSLDHLEDDPVHHPLRVFKVSHSSGYPLNSICMICQSQYLTSSVSWTRLEVCLSIKNEVTTQSVKIPQTIKVYKI